MKLGKTKVMSRPRCTMHPDETLGMCPYCDKVMKTLKELSHKYMSPDEETDEYILMVKLSDAESWISELLDNPDIKKKVIQKIFPDSNRGKLAALTAIYEYVQELKKQIKS